MDQVNAHNRIHRRPRKGQGSRVTSSSIGGLTFANCSARTRKAIDSRSSASGSDGCHVSSERALAKWMTCCPVPLAISSTHALCGQNARKDIEYRALVPLRRRDKPFPVSQLFATLPKHRSSSPSPLASKKRHNTRFLLNHQVRSSAAHGTWSSGQYTQPQCNGVSRALIPVSLDATELRLFGEHAAHDKRPGRR